jgi:hypothetical protein
MRYFVGKTPSVEDRPSLLDSVIARARATFPSEDGWVVVNLVRMEQILEEISATSDDSVSDEEVVLQDEPLPTRAGSLAEAIIMGNVVAALEMIASRPMVALADAASELDALYRFRKGEEVSVSQMLTQASQTLTLGQLQGAINALSSAIDGTYTDEASAVKIAIMKAIKEVTV